MKKTAYGRIALMMLIAGPALSAPQEDHWSADPTGPLAEVRAMILAGQAEAALAVLRPIAAADPGFAEAHNLIGFALRKAGRLAEAGVAYQRALVLDPHHLGALEYQGEMFVELGEIARAGANLKRLTQLCPAGCEEREDLVEALAKAR